MKSMMWIYLSVVLLISGCSAMPDNYSGSDLQIPALQQGSKIVKAIIEANFQKFSEGANEIITDNGDADNFAASCKNLQEIYGKAGSFRFLGELQTPLLVNQLFAVKFKKYGADGKTVEHEQLLQLIFAKENSGKYKLLGMRFM